jgi:hypothetical protein
MAKKTIYRTVIEIEVLSEEPIPDGISLDDIEEECNTGSYSGVHDWKIRNEPLTGEAAADALSKQGTSTDFFGMDEVGNDISDDDDY